MPWTDQHTGKHYQITTEGFHGSRLAARVKTYGEVLREYEFHPGSKSADVNGRPSGKQTIGLLQRRHIRVGQIIYIGKESDSLEEIESGTIRSPQVVLNADENTGWSQPATEKESGAVEVNPSQTRRSLARSHSNR